MAHRVTAPALQRAQRLLSQWVRPSVAATVARFDVEATAEFFEPISYSDAIEMPRTPFGIGNSWGKPWHTVWFKLSTVVPEDAARLPLVAAVDLGFSGRGDGFQVEGMAWLDGHRVQAVQPDRRLVPLGQRAPGDRVELWIEAAATPIIAGHAFGYGPTPLGDPSTSGDAHLYALKRADLAVYSPATDELAVLLQSMIDLIVDSEEDSPRRARLFDLLDRVFDLVDVGSVADSAPAAIEKIRAESERWSQPSSHTITAVGHAHLDTAWLWPIRETRRKAVRTFANAVRLLEENPDAVFCHSQAQHYDWVRTEAPDIFEKVKDLVAAGRWEPVGGMWVETDLNLPAGESLIRQFLLGRRAFDEWFGANAVATARTGAFLPDDFGYPGTFPQIIRHCGGEWFFSQKLSWNESNRFPHHSFWWEGIDGSRVFAHFSPIETYNALLMPSQLRFAERNFSDHAGSSNSLALYGHGDGGGGPTQQMIDRARHSSLWSDVPRVKFGTVSGFFDEARAEYGQRAPVWAGEMYLEKHRGTYSSQVATKNGNRRCEQLLHEWELWSVALGGETPDRARERRDLWRRVLTQQFHDIIPGSSITWVHLDAEREHSAVAAAANARIDELFDAGTSESAAIDMRATRLESSGIANPAPVDVRGVANVAGENLWVEVPALSTVGADRIRDLPDDVAPVVVDQGSEGAVTISNGIVSVSIDASGAVTEVVDVRRGRSIVRAGANIGLQTRRDTPAEYDAWDIDRADADSPATVLRAQGPAILVTSGDLAAAASTVHAFGNSLFELTVTVRAGESVVDFRLDGDWRERETRLQFTAPIDVFAREAVCGIQFGHVRRPRHSNTPWDAAKFEVCAHRYVYVSEPGCGAAIVADGPRGYDVRGDSLDLTLLRSPSFPDPHCDEGRQIVEWGLYVDGGPGDVGELERICAARSHPLRLVRGRTEPVASPIRCEIPGALISAVKPAEDASGDIVVRLWETRGARARGVLSAHGAVSAARADALEVPYEEVRVIASSIEDLAGRACVIDLELRPFEIATLRLRRNR